MEVLLVFGCITGMTFLGVNVLLHFFVYPRYLLSEYMNYNYNIGDSTNRRYLFKEFIAYMWIPVSKGTVAFSLICGVVGTLLLWLRLMVNQMV